MRDLLARSWWMFAWRGAVAVLFGVLAWMWPGLTLLWLVAMFAAYTILVTGVFDIVVAIRLRKVLRREWLLILSGVVAIAFGVLVLFFPGAGALALVWLISFYAVLSGVLLLSLAWQARKWGSGRTTPG